MNHNATSNIWFNFLGLKSIKKCAAVFLMIFFASALSFGQLSYAQTNDGKVSDQKLNQTSQSQIYVDTPISIQVDSLLATGWAMADVGVDLGYGSLGTGEGDPLDLINEVKTDNGRTLKVSGLAQIGVIGGTLIVQVKYTKMVGIWPFKREESTYKNYPIVLKEGETQTFADDNVSIKVTMSGVRGGRTWDIKEALEYYKKFERYDFSYLFDEGAGSEDDYKEFYLFLIAERLKKEFDQKNSKTCSTPFK